MFVRNLIKALLVPPMAPSLIFFILLVNLNLIKNADLFTCSVSYLKYFSARLAVSKLTDRV